MFSNELWQKSGVSTYSIDQSIRFNSADSTYMQRTHGAGGNVDKFSVSFWFKRSNLGTDQYMFGSGADANNTSDINFNTSDQLTFWSYIGGYQTRLITTQVFRDPSAWYHCVVVYDSGNAVSTERARLYINGARVTSFGTETYPSQNQDGIVGSNVNIGFGRYISYGGSYFDGYLAEMNYVNGLALDPSSFGEYNDSGIWIPKEYSGSYGTGGFKVDGRDSADLGDDESGNGNDLTTSGLAADDQKPDTPTNNQITFNPLNNQRSGGTPSNGNLDYVGPSTRTLITLTANLPTSGKWCCAFKVQAVSNNAGWQIGVGYADDSNLGDAAGSNEDVSIIRMSTSSSDLEIFDAIAGSGIDPSQAITTSDEFWVAQDMDAGKTYLGIYDASATAMVWIANDAGLDGNPSAGTNETKTNSALAGSDNVVITVGSKASNAVYLQKSGDVDGTVPTGFTYFENVKDLI
tara:strand:- start:1911 stop:3296 length:1386 start_codon:yes stop_codon:yes gene_type:complete